ncbi:MAG: ComEC/Rec2 family competence protein [Muribaculaceae bacterium]|nr:ComEC/Rec2 family competence protein [Muribaculaceae bacterium]
MYKGPLIPVLALAGGIAVSSVLALSWWTGTIPIVLGITVYIYLINSSKDPVSAFRKGKWHPAWVIMLFVGIGITDQSLSRPLPLDQAFGGIIPDSVNCEVRSVLAKTYGERIDAVIDGTNGAKVRIRSGVSSISPGDIIRIPTKGLKETASDTTVIGRRIRPMMEAAGILYTGRITPGNIKVEGRSNSPRYFFMELREKIEIAIERRHIGKATSDFLCAILMGDKTGLDEETRLTFANGGMAHMLALSGLHIGILAGFLMFLLWPIRLMGRYRWSYAVAIVMLWLYVAVTGMAYSSVRACIMTTFAFIGIMAERKNFAGNALASACLLILIFDPSALFDAGFQLSVVCVGALIAFASRLNPIGHRQHPTLFYICGAVIATIVATVSSWVLTSYYFSQVPLMFLPSNLLLLPALPFYLSFAIVFIALSSVGVEIGWMAHTLDFGYEIMLKSIESLSYGTEFVIDYQVPLWGVLLWLALLGAAAYAINRKETK